MHLDSEQVWMYNGLSGFTPSHFEFNNPSFLNNQVSKCVGLIQKKFWNFAKNRAQDYYVASAAFYRARDTQITLATKDISLPRYWYRTQDFLMKILKDSEDVDRARDLSNHPAT